jgi:hypothetical protein
MVAEISIRQLAVVEGHGPRRAVCLQRPTKEPQ